jgi:feruloyl-CoA synthase
MASDGGRHRSSNRSRARDAPSGISIEPESADVRLPTDSPVRRVRILTPDTIVRPGAGGSLYARSPYELGPYPETMTEPLEHWARVAPDRTFLAARDPDGQWRRLAYAALLDQVRSVGQALVDRELSANRAIVILSGNGLEHAVLAIAAMYVGVPYAPVAPSYSLLSRDYATLAAIWSLMRPGLVFAADGPRFERALASLPTSDVEIVTVEPLRDRRRATPFASLVETAPRADVDTARRRVGPDTVAKVLFTSGSTGAPKGVINTQRMLTANQEQIRTVMAFLGDEPPVLCDWLPWNHTFGGNHNFGLTLYNGGTLYLDAGSPTAAGFSTTLANLREIATTAYFNVPRAYEMLLPPLAADTAFRRLFFSRLKMLFYAAAGLRQQVSDDFEALAIDACGERIPWVTGLGATETAPFAMCTGAMADPVAGRIGVPVPGVELKVARVGSRLEARVRGPNVMPGYWRDPDLTAESFDEEAFYRMGDAVGLVDPKDAARGFTFQGRLTEDFKLSTGTWVRVGPLRAAVLSHFGDLIQDVVIAGHDRAEVGVLVFPNLATCRRIAGWIPDGPVRDALAHPEVLSRFRSALQTFAAGQPGSSTRVERALLLEQPPSIDAREVTDKGSINQRAVLAHRQTLVEELYGAAGSSLVIDVSSRSGTRDEPPIDAL